MSGAVADEPAAEAVILCVEPDPIIGEIVRTAVEGLGSRIVLVASAESALRELASLPRAIVVTDDDLGGSRGVDLVGTIRDAYSEVEVVLLTADANVVGLVSRLRVERLNCVKRPFGLEELRSGVALAMARYEKARRRAVRPTTGTPGTSPQELPAGLRVLVVDDDPVVRRSMARTFRAHEVVLAENGRAATLEIERRKPDLIVTDLRMPEMDGFAFADEVKTRWPELSNRILFLSGTDSHIERARAEVPLAPLLRKPASGEELERRMAEVLEAASLTRAR